VSHTNLVIAMDLSHFSRFHGFTEKIYIPIDNMYVKAKAPSIYIYIYI
jgi:hypothetical protein